MVTRIKTTVELPDALARRAKELAREHQLSLRELITEGLRAEVERLSAPPPVAAPFRLRTVAGRGLRPGVSEEGLIERAHEGNP